MRPWIAALVVVAVVGLVLAILGSDLVDAVGLGLLGVAAVGAVSLGFFAVGRSEDRAREGDAQAGRARRGRGPPGARRPSRSPSGPPTAGSPPGGRPGRAGIRSRRASCRRTSTTAGEGWIWAAWQPRKLPVRPAPAGRTGRNSAPAPK